MKKIRLKQKTNSFFLNFFFIQSRTISFDTRTLTFCFEINFFLHSNTFSHNLFFSSIQEQRYDRDKYILIGKPQNFFFSGPVTKASRAQWPHFCWEFCLELQKAFLLARPLHPPPLSGRAKEPLLRFPLDISMTHENLTRKSNTKIYKRYGKGPEKLFLWFYPELLLSQPKT